MLSERELRALLRELLRTLDVQPPFDPIMLCDRLAQHRDRPIILDGRPLPTGAALGVLVPFPAKDVIIYQSEASRTHQAHIIFHEVAHLVRAHTSEGDTAVCGSLVDTGPDRRGTLYDRWQEWEAETAATILSDWSRRSSLPSAGGLAAQRRLSGALGGHRAW